MTDAPLKIAVAAVRAVAGQRLPGYVDAVLARSVRPPDTHVYLTAAAYVELQTRFRAGPIIGTPPPVPPKPRRTGPELWAALHTARDPSPALVTAVRAELGCGDCLIHFDAMLVELPPVYAPLPAWRRRVGEWHNRVNRRRGVREWSPAESDARWPL